MTPLYLNPPSSSPNFPLTKDHHHHHQDDHQIHLFMINSPPSSQTHDLTQTHFTDHLQRDHEHKVNKSIHEAGSFSQGKNKSSDPEELHMSAETESNGSAKWMSSKVRLMRKMISYTDDKSTTHDHEQHQTTNTTRRNNNTDSFNTNNNNNGAAIRVCSDCNTTTTPLWRSGPRGPKSLCNACGIRQRKARRAMAEAASRSVGADHQGGTNYNNKVQNKDKKPRTGLVGTMKKQCKPQETVASSSNSQKKLYFKDFALSLSNNSTFQRVFPKDEEEAAILLMELSCGLVHS